MTKRKRSSESGAGYVKKADWPLARETGDSIPRAMKLIRVPWIRCRADEYGAAPFPLEWRGRNFEVLAYSEAEARDWWKSLADGERESALGLGTREEAGLF